MKIVRLGSIALLTIALVIPAGCRRGEDRGEKAQGEDAEKDERAAPRPAAAEAEKKVEQLVAAWKQTTWARPALVASGATAKDCAAGDHYAKAMVEANKNAPLVGRARHLKAVKDFWDPSWWNEANPQIDKLKEFAKGTAATAIADHLRAGAACTRGAAGSIGERGEEPELRSTFWVSAFVAALALHWAETGKAKEASFLLLANMRMFHDLERGGNITHMAIGHRQIGKICALLDHVAEKLNAEELAEIAAGYRVVLDSTPSFAEVMRGEHVFMTSLVFAIATKTTRRPSLHKEYIPVAKSLHKIGGLQAILEGGRKQAAALKGVDQMTLPETLALLDRVHRDVWAKVPEMPSHARQALRYWTMNREVAAHYLALLARAARKKTGNWPPTLELLGDVPRDPVSGKSFEYEAGKAIRSKPIDCGSIPGCEPSKIGIAEVALTR